MKKLTRNTLVALGGTALAIAAIVTRGLVPEVVRYVRIRRM